MTNGKFLAIDLGDKRVGLAITDPSKQIAFPRDFLVHESLDDLCRQVRNFCAKENVERIIIGWPVELDGTEGERAQKTRAFGKKLATFVDDDIEIDYMDERLTTKQATQLLFVQGVKSRDQKGQKDMISAQLILEAYLRSITN